MVNLYATLIINKRRTFDQVPEKFKADVEAKLLEYGYDFWILGIYPRAKQTKSC